MLLRVDTTDAVPVYAQIVEQVKRAVAAGVLDAGDALPSLREMAMKLRINPLTVGRAYKQLEQEGLIETRHGLGSFVAGSAKSPAREFGRDAIARGIDRVLVDAMDLGVGFDEVREVFEERLRAAPQSLRGQAAGGDEVRDEDR
ncbi:MAG: GntR family transcriptional regulator [Armatimonadetes bacterium]|nr:GntR family transcriptional regulator [Armatimonadota bacterium]